MKLLKKTFALMLSLILVVGMIPATALTANAASTNSIRVYGVEMSDGTYLATGAIHTTTSKPSGGYAYWKDDVLTLHNFKIDGGQIVCETSYTLYLEGTNTIIATITQHIKETTAIFSSKGSLTIDGDGILNVTSDGTCLYAYDDLIINGGILNLKGEFGVDDSDIFSGLHYTYGEAPVIDAGDTLYINGGYVYAEGMCGACAEAVYFNGGTCHFWSASEGIRDTNVDLEWQAISIGVGFYATGNPLILVKESGQSFEKSALDKLKDYMDPQRYPKYTELVVINEIEFANQFPEMPAGKTEHNLGKVSPSEYVMTFGAIGTLSQMGNQGYKVIEKLIVFDRDNNKIVDTVTNNPKLTGTGISYSLKNLPSGNYIIRESIILYDKDGKALYGNNNDFILEVETTVNFTNQSPAMPDGASMQFINATEGDSLTFTFDNEDVRSPYTVEKYLSLTGPGIASAETETKGDSGALEFTRTFDQAGMYTLKEVLRLKNGSDTVKTKTHTFYIFVNEKPLVTPTITTQPNDVTNASGDSVTLTAKAENAERARWYVEKSDGTVTALGDAFAANGTSTQTISKASNAVGNRYFCAFWSVDGKIAKTDSVTVCFVPTVTNGSDVIVNEGTTAYLKVTASGCNHYASANGWYAPGASSEVSGSKYYPMGTTLCIKNVTEADEGTYTYKYVTEHGDVATGTVKLVVNTGSSSTTINTFDIFGLDNPMIIGTYADTTVSVPENANYTAEVIDCTFDDASGIVTSGSGTVTIKLTPNTGYLFKPSGNISGTIDGITKAFSRYEGSSIIVVVDYNDYSAWKIAYPANDTISISTDSLTFKVGTAANGQKVEGDYKCTHSGLADTNLHHTGMKYAVYSGIADNEMPAGLTLNADGTITGTPTTAGVYTVMVRADSVNANGTVSNCSGLAVKAIEIIVEDKDAHTHDTAVVSDTATCTTDGVKTLKCGCTVESPAKGHDWEAWGPVEVPTCQQSALTITRTCKNDSSHTENKTINPMHMSADDWSTDATDHWKVCTYGCGTIVVDKVAHTDADSNKKCDVCGYDMTPAQSTTEYDITVTGGTASANKAVAGTSITLTAEQIDGKVFSHWEVNGATVSDANAKETTFTMGNADVTAEAIYDDCECKCHKGGIVGFFYKIVLFFQKLFGNNLVCNCGKKH